MDAVREKTTIKGKHIAITGILAFYKRQDALDECTRGVCCVSGKIELYAEHGLCIKKLGWKKERELGRRAMPEYVLRLIAYKVMNELREGRIDGCHRACGTTSK